jgi:Protein of unknown function (DUF3592)
MSIPLLLGSLLSVGLGLLLWTLAARALKLRRAMRRWPLEKGIVRNHRTRIQQRSVQVDVLVRFSHKDREHAIWCASPTGSAYGPGSGDQGLRQEKARFPVGATVDVYVNPREPEQAFLELPESHMVVALLCFGALLIGLPVGMYLPAWFEFTEEMADLGFMLLLGAVLSVFAISMGYALFRTYFPQRRPN